MKVLGDCTNCTCFALCSASVSSLFRSCLLTYTFYPLDWPLLGGDRGKTVMNVVRF